MGIPGNFDNLGVGGNKNGFYIRMLKLVSIKAGIRGGGGGGGGLVQIQ